MKEWDYVKAKRAALRFARVLAHKNLILVGRFKQIHPLTEDLNDCGPEWMAIDLRDERKYVTVWYGSGRRDEANMVTSCDIIKIYGRFKFGISLRPRIKNLKIVGMKSALGVSTIVN
jgi:hypothetical protein